MVWYRLAADLVLIAHTAFIAFVVGGLFVTVAGWWRGWGWTRNGWFRAVHLGFIGYVIFESWMAIACPLTTWENSLRISGGQEPYGEAGCIAHWLHRVIFFEARPWVFTVCYSLFGLLVVLTWVFVPPRFRRRELTPPAAG